MRLLPGHCLSDFILNEGDQGLRYLVAQPVGSYILIAEKIVYILMVFLIKELALVRRSFTLPCVNGISNIIRYPQPKRPESDPT
jgi:hypothetical protein